MLVILTTGNYNFFNFLTISLCLPCLDDTFWRGLRGCCRVGGGGGRGRTGDSIGAAGDGGGGADGDDDEEEEEDDEAVAAAAAAAVAVIPPLWDVLSWQFLEQQGLCEFLAALCAHVRACVRRVSVCRCARSLARALARACVRAYVRA